MKGIFRMIGRFVGGMAFPLYLYHWVGMFVANGAVDRLKTYEREIVLTKIWPRFRTVLDRLDITIDDLVERA